MAIQLFSSYFRNNIIFSQRKMNFGDMAFRHMLLYFYLNDKHISVFTLKMKRKFSDIEGWVMYTEAVKGKLSVLKI